MSFTSGQQQSGLDRLSSTLTVPSRHQQLQQAFAMTPASYNHIMDPLSELNDDDADANLPDSTKQSRLDQAMAAFHAKKTEVEKSGFPSRASERSALNVPDTVMNDFRDFVRQNKQINTNNEWANKLHTVRIYHFAICPYRKAFSVYPRFQAGVLEAGLIWPFNSQITTSRSGFTTCIWLWYRPATKKLAGATHDINTTLVHTIRTLPGLVFWPPSGGWTFGLRALYLALRFSCFFASLLKQRKSATKCITNNELHCWWWWPPRPNENSRSTQIIKKAGGRKDSASIGWMNCRVGEWVDHDLRRTRHGRGKERTRWHGRDCPFSSSRRAGFSLEEYSLVFCGMSWNQVKGSAAIRTFQTSRRN